MAIEKGITFFPIQGTVSLRWPPPFQRSRCYTYNHPAHWFQKSSPGRPRPLGWIWRFFFLRPQTKPVKNIYEKNPCPPHMCEKQNTKKTQKKLLQLKWFLKQTPKMCVCVCVYQVCVFFMGWLYGCGQKGHIWNQCYSNKNLQNRG